MRTSLEHLGFRAFAAAMLAVMAFRDAIAGERGLAENYLVCVELDKPAIFYYEQFLKTFRFAEDYEQILVFKQNNPQKWTPERIEKQWNKKWQDEYYSKEPFLYSSIFQQAIIAKKYKEFKDLSSLIRTRHNGQGVPCAIGEYVCIDNTNSVESIPFVVEDVGASGEITLRETLSGKSGSFSEEDWGKYFRMDGQWHDPAVRKIWVTSWEDISGRWNKLLEEGNAKEVRRQIKAIVDSGRFNSAGGEEWRGNIGKWWSGSAAKVAPRLKIVNDSGGERAISLNWNVRDVSNEESTLGPTALVEKTVPFGGIEGREITAVVQYFMPGCKCCGYQEAQVTFTGPFADDQPIAIKKGKEPWETSGIATIDVAIGNIDERKLSVKFEFKSGKRSYTMPLKLGYTDVWTWEVPAHAGGSVIVYEDGRETPLTSLSIDGNELHRGKTVNKRLKLQNVVRKPELLCQKDIRFEGEKQTKDTLLKVEIKKNYAIFNGEKANFSNPELLDGHDILHSGAAEIPMKATLVNGAYPPEDLKRLAARILNPKGESVWTGEATMVFNEKPETTNSFIRIPQQTFYLGSWQTCRKEIDAMNIEPAQRGKVLKALSNEKTSWKGDILEYVKTAGLLPKARIWNGSGERVKLALNGGLVTMENGQYHDVEIAGAKIPEIHVCKILSKSEEPLLDAEYASNNISSKIQKWPKEWGESIEHTITAKDIELKPAPVILLSWPPDLTNVEVVAYGQHHSPTGNTMEIKSPRMTPLGGQLVLRSGNYEPYEPKISANLRYFGLRYGQTEKLVITTNLLEKKSEPLPESEVIDEPKVTQRQVDRLRNTLENAVSGLVGSGNRETAMNNIRGVMPYKNKTMKALIDAENSDNDQVEAARRVLTDQLELGGNGAETVLRIWGWL